MCSQERFELARLNQESINLALTQLGDAASGASAGQKRAGCREQEESSSSAKRQCRAAACEAVELLFLRAGPSGTVSMGELRCCIAAAAPEVTDTKLELALLRPAADLAARIQMVINLLN